MRALVFENRLARLILTKLLSLLSWRAFVARSAPLRLREIDEPALPADDWVRIQTRLCGICGSDAKQVFLNGATDNPMTALISFPQVLGHEVVGTIESIGPGVTTLQVGQRVVLNPWLSCEPRGLPLCEWCQRGELAQCRNFTRGVIEPGVHTGNSRHATGGFAPLLPAHASQCIPVPAHVSDEEAVLADPFSVSLHAALHGSPPTRGRALVYGCGTLGLLQIAILRALFPELQVLAVARFDHQAELAEAFGAHRVFRHRPKRALIEQVARALGVELQQPWRGLPMLNGGVDCIYDTVGSPETLEVGVRIARPRGRIVVTGVEAPQRFEWTPLYFKEISLVGSNAFGFETLDGRRQHAMQWYFELLGRHEFGLTRILTHRFALEEYPAAFAACWNQGRERAVKVLFEYP